MAKARAIVKRRKAVQNIRKITSTMQLIATARYARCLQRATASQPYTDAITEMVQTLSRMGGVEHPLLKTNDSRDTLLLTITSNRGLCGSYNAGVLRLSNEHRRQLREQGYQPALEMVGKRGINYAKFLRIDLARTITDVDDKIAYARVAEMAERYMRAYEAGEIGRVEVVYTKFESAATQRPTVAQLLPMKPPAGDDVADAGQQTDFEFSPAPESLLGSLIPETVKIRLYQYFNDAIVSEQVSRMVAMKAATDAAGDMIRILTQRYNRARQTQITMELLDIVGGAEALS